MAALCYLYKIHYLTGPQMLTRMLTPPKQYQTTTNILRTPGSRRGWRPATATSCSLISQPILATTSAGRSLKECWTPGTSCLANTSWISPTRRGCSPSSAASTDSCARATGTGRPTGCRDSAWWFSGRYCERVSLCTHIMYDYASV